MSRDLVHARPRKAANRAFEWLVRPLYSRATRRVLRDELDRREMIAFSRDTWQHFRELASELPAEPTRGAALMVRFAALTTACYEALARRGTEPAKARERVASINWSVYEKLIKLHWAVTLLFGRDRLRRVKRSMDWYMRFPYASPGYEMEWVRNEPGVVGFDVHRCPAAEYFHNQNLDSLCTDAFCDLDIPLARVWGVRLERTQTIAKGCAYCNFRFYPRDSESAPTSKDDS